MTGPLRSRLRRAVVTLVAIGCGASGLSSCQQEADPTLIAFLLASDQASRWVNADEPAFRKQVKRTCRGCEYLTYNAQREASTQADQFAAALDAGADVIVMNAVDVAAATTLIEDEAGDVPVVAYDRFVPGADYYVSYDANSTGTLQAQATVEALDGTGSVLIVNGAMTDANGVAIKLARDAVFGKTKIKVLAELDPSSWSGDEAGAWVVEQVKRHPIKQIDAIVAANDGQAAGIVDALAAEGIGPKRLPYITGQDAELTALQRIVRGEQAMTVYKPIVTEAEQAADIAVTLATGGVVTGTTLYEGVPSFIFAPRAVTVQNLTNTVVRDGLHTSAEICDEATARRCERLGIH